MMWQLTQAFRLFEIGRAFGTAEGLAAHLRQQAEPGADDERGCFQLAESVTELAELHLAAEHPVDNGGVGEHERHAEDGNHQHDAQGLWR